MRPGTHICENGIVRSLFLGLLAAVPVLQARASGAERLVTAADDFPAAVSTAQPGDVIVLANGTWRDVDLDFAAAGTAEAPVTLRAETPGRAMITGDSRLRMAGRHLVVEGLWFDQVRSPEDVVQFRRSSSEPAQHCRFTQCVLTDCNPSDLDEDTKWISLYGQDNRIDHCWIEGKRNAGTTLVVWLGDDPNRHRIDHNYFGPRPRLGKNGGETIRVGTSDWSLHDSATVVEHNVFQQCNGEIEIISNKSCANLYRFNLFLECAGALTLRHGNRCTVEGNLFLGGGRRDTGGVRIIGEDHRVFNNYFAGLRGDNARSAISFMKGIPDSPLNGYAQVQRTVVAFNSFVDCTHPFALAVDGGDAATLEPRDVVIADNILQLSEPLVFDVPQLTQTNGWQLEGNLIESPAPSVAPVPGFSVTQLMFERDPDGLLRTTAASPTVDAGSRRIPYVSRDFDGQERDGRPDAGCDEASPDTQRATALQDADIGPDWKRWNWDPQVTPDHPR